MKLSTTILLLLLALAGCNTKKPAENSKPEIAVSILPQEYFVQQIAGDYFTINVLIPPGASPATYEPTTSQLVSLTKSDLYLKMGHTGFEMAWMNKLSSANKKMKVIDLSEGVDLIIEETTHDQAGHDHAAHGHGHGGVDPHTWLSPVNVKVISQNIYNALSEAYPEMEEEFSKNLVKFHSELDSLHNHISNSLKDLESRAFFTYHPSLSYFSRDYNLEQYPLELGGKTPSAGHMKYLIDKGRENKIGVVFLQMQFDQKNAEVLADEIEAEIVQINPLDNKWIEQMIFITDKLVENLQ